MARPVDLRLDTENGNVIYVERSTIKSENRLQIPALGRRCVKWLKENSAIKVLVELAEPGCLIVRPWKPYGEEVVARLRDVRHEDVIEADDRPVLVGIGIRFLPSTIEATARLVFHEPLFRHLGIHKEEPPELLIVSSTDRIEIWNDTYFAEVEERLGKLLKSVFPWSGTQY